MDNTELIITEQAELTHIPINEELMMRWIAFVDGTPKTVQTYTRAVRQFIRFLMRNGVTHPTREDVIRFREELLLECKPTTVASYLQATKLFFRWLASEDLYPNIADNVKGVKLDDSFKKGYLTEGQVKDLLQSVDRSSVHGKRDYAILSIMVTCGLRVVEIVRANVEDYSIKGASAVLYVQGKGHTERTDYVKLAEPVEAALRDYLSVRGKASPGEPLFCSVANRNAGERMTTRSVSRIVKEQLARIGIDREDITAHSLRHTAGVQNIMHDGSLLETQVLLRHKNPSTTQRYTHAAEREKNNSEARLAKAFFTF